MGGFKLLNCVTQRMGCTGSKESDEGGGGGGSGGGAGGAGKGAAAGANAAAGGAGGVPNADPRIPMTAKQKYSIVASWKGIHRALEPTGILMFVKLFEEHSDILDLFEKFSSLRTKEEQQESLELAEHASMVMNTLHNAISSLDNPDAFFQFVEQVGASHRRIPGFKKEYFWKIEKPFLEAVKTTLDERYTENIESIYKIAIRLIIEALISGYEKGQQGGG